jgi:hypothetical protein
MYENLGGLRFRNVYAGIVMASAAIGQDLYKRVTTHVNDTMSELTTWYFDHEDETGAFWIAVGGQHIEPVGAWLKFARDSCECLSAIAGVIDNDGTVPSSDACHFQIARKSLSAKQVRTLAQANQFTLFLPHCDSFLVLVDDSARWHFIRQALNQTGRPLTELTFVHRTKGLPRPSSAVRYDAIDAQLSEVKRSVTEEARSAVSELIAGWESASPDAPVPRDIEGRRSVIDAEHHRIATLIDAVRRGAAANTDVLSQVDRYAQNLRATRRAAFDLRAKLRDYEWSPTAEKNYGRMAAPLMLRAMERYAVDVARRFGLNGYVFLPVLGEEFSIRSPIFRLFPRQRQPTSPSTVIVEVPAEVRLRLGALPMIAREIARLKFGRIEQIAKLFADLENRGDSCIKSLLPPRTDLDLPQYRQFVEDVGRSLAADLLATTFAGPQFVFALARFAVGVLSGIGDDWRPQDGPAFPARVAACVSLLRSLGLRAQFETVYLSTSGLELPSDIVGILREEMKHIEYPYDDELQTITEQLSSGQIVAAPPISILAALWRAVADRSGYLNELAAVMSVADWR